MSRGNNMVINVHNAMVQMSSIFYTSFNDTIVYDA